MPWFRRTPERERHVLHGKWWMFHGWDHPLEWGKPLDPTFGQPRGWSDRAQNVHFAWGTTTHDLVASVDALVDELLAIRGS